MISLSLRTNFERARKVLADYPEQLRKAILEGMARASELIVKKAQENLTSNKSVFGGPLRASMGYKLDKEKLRSVIGPAMQSKTGGAEGSPANYGFFVEFGRAAGGFPPPRVLELWIRRKLEVGDDVENRRLQFLIGRKIAKEGIEPAPFLGPALDDNVAGVMKKIDQALERMIVRLNLRGDREV